MSFVGNIENGQKPSLKKKKCKKNVFKGNL